jgi:LacI family transcriptional regulator
MKTVKTNRITIKDVAAKAGVSIQTVSRVINGHPDVSVDTRGRIQRVIAELNYHPDALARSLITRNSDAVGVIAGGFELYGPSRLLSGIERQAALVGWHLFLQSAEQEHTTGFDEAVANLISQRVAGIIWAFPELNADRGQALLKQVAPHAPIIFLSMNPIPNAPVICVDNRAGARMATAHLVAQGRKKIGLITGQMDLWSGEQRRLGWHDALSAARLPRSKKQLAIGNWTPTSGEDGLRQLLKDNPDLDAVFASNDQMALGALRLAHKLGRRVPDDLAIVGFDNMPESAFLTPALTTVQNDLIALGRLAVSELHRVVTARRENRVLEAPSAIMIQPSLVVRESG